jgi:hypothetical protein
MVLGQELAKKHPEQRASEHNRKYNRTACYGTYGNTIFGFRTGILAKTTAVKFTAELQVNFAHVRMCRRYQGMEWSKLTTINSMLGQNDLLRDLKA